MDETALELFGEAIGRELRKLVERMDGMQSRIDRAVSFCGDWQPAQDYARGAMVRHAGGVWVAIRAVPAGKAAPGRDGGPWESLA